MSSQWPESPEGSQRHIVMESPIAPLQQISSDMTKEHLQGEERAGSSPTESL